MKQRQSDTYKYLSTFAITLEVHLWSQKCKMKKYLSFVHKILLVFFHFSHDFLNILHPLIIINLQFYIHKYTKKDELHKLMTLHFFWLLSATTTP